MILIFKVGDVNIIFSFVLFLHFQFLSVVMKIMVNTVYCVPSTLLSICGFTVDWLVPSKHPVRHFVESGHFP